MIGKTFGTCTRRNIGAVLVVNNRISGAAWNGMERAPILPTCRMGECPRGKLTSEEQPHGIGYGNCIYLHAEINALNNYRNLAGVRHIRGWARRIGIALYVSDEPCEDCREYADWSGCTMIWRERP